MAESETTTVAVPSSRMGEVRERIAKANRRLERAGIAERFELKVGSPRLVERRNEADIVTDRYNVVDVELATPQIGYNGWTFVATLSFEEAGTIVRTVPGAECSYRPTSKVCDQCGTDRYRRETFVVRSEAGEYKQIGRNCLALFFGLKPSLWVYEVELSEFDDDREESRGGSRGVEIESVRSIVAAALGATDGGVGYVSKARAEANGQTPTSGRVWEVLYGKNLPVTGRDADRAREYNAKLAEDRTAARRYLDDGAVVAEVIAAGAAISGDSEYAENIRILAACEAVEVKNIGLVASMVSVWKRGVEKAARSEVENTERAARRNEWIGAVGDKKIETIGTITALRTIEGNYGTTLLIEWVTDEGFTCKWFASNWYRHGVDGADGIGVCGTPVEVGTRVAVVGTVKRHEERNGFKATSFTRCKLAAV